MKKRISALLMALFLMAALCTTALAADFGVNYVTDISDLLTYEEWEALENRAQDIALRTGCGVYIVTLEDYTDYGEGSVHDVAAQIFNNADNGFGVGTDRSGVLLLLSMDARDWALLVYGESALYAFDDYGQAALENSFLPAFGEDNWYGGFSGYLDACDQYLALASNGSPVRESALRRILPMVGVACVISLVICLILKGKMKTIHRKVEAKAYVSFGGLNLIDSYDRYTHTTERVRHIEKNSSGGTGGGDSGRNGKF